MKTPATVIDIKPYIEIENIVYRNNTKIIINAEIFQDIQYTSGNTVFVFKKCRFDELCIENTEYIDFKVISFTFLDCYIDRIEVEKMQIKNCTFFFGNCIVDGKINNPNINSVTLNNCFILSGFFAIDTKRITVSFTSSDEKNIKWFKRLPANKQNYILENVQYLSFTADDGFLEPHKTNLKISLSLNYRRKINNVSVKISRSKLIALTFTGTPVGKIDVKNTTINSLYIHNFRPEGECVFYNIKPEVESIEKKLEIHECNLDSVWLDCVNIKDYEEISFYRSNFGNIKITSCEFPYRLKDFKKIQTLENIHYPDKKDDNYYRLRYDTFMQLKRVLEKYDEFYEGQRLRAVSLESLRKVEALPFWDKVILFLNSITNNHGLSIARALVCFLCASIVLYLLYLLSIGRIYWGGEIDFYLVGSYFEFLDITHDVDFLVERVNLSGWSLFIDYLNKIIVGFLIFQFIAAFRKYIKK